MNEKIKIISIIILFAVVIFGSGCATQRIVVTTDADLLSAQRSVDKLQRIDDRLGDIVSRAAKLTSRAIGGIDEALDLLDEYDEFVLGLIRTIADLRREIQSGTGQASAANDSAGYNERPVCVYGISEN